MDHLTWKFSDVVDRKHSHVMSDKYIYHCIDRLKSIEQYMTGHDYWKAANMADPNALQLSNVEIAVGDNNGLVAFCVKRISANILKVGTYSIAMVCCLLVVVTISYSLFNFREIAEAHQSEVPSFNDPQAIYNDAEALADAQSDTLSSDANNAIDGALR